MCANSHIDNITNSMSLVTSQQQSIIEAAVDSYILTHDNVVFQYLKFRQSVVEVTAAIQREKEENDEVSQETLLRLHELNLENEKMKLFYPAYVDRLEGRISFAENNAPQYLSELEKNYQDLLHKTEKIKKQLADLKDVHAPVVRKMANMVAKFEMLFGRSRQHGTLGFRDNKPNPDAIIVDYQSSVFEIKELKESLQALDVELRKLKTVDEVDDGNHTISEKLHSIDTLQHLDTLLMHSRAVRRMDDKRVSFDLSRSDTLPNDAKNMSVDDYELTILSLVNDIKELVAAGAGAKERWVANARKLQAIDELLAHLDEPMDVD